MHWDAYSLTLHYRSLEILEYKNGAHSVSLRILAYAENVGITARSEKNHKKWTFKEEGKSQVHESNRESDKYRVFQSW